MVPRYISVNCDIAAADGDDNTDIDNIWWYLYSEGDEWGRGEGK